MAKIGDLQISTEKIALNAATTFFSPSVDGNGTYSITIVNSSAGPNLIYVGGKSGGSMGLRRSRDNASIGVLIGNASRGVFIDDDHQATETYTASNITAGSTGIIVGGVARMK